ncbi:MAG: 30S ribosomal protein S12 methylthiotransferase RimO [Candidatus Aminicenantes bacterium]|nr:30S ribosomal protein S12 methylthiotransferase RimO [Candidatus Aminicenantes bacterium]
MKKTALINLGCAKNLVDSEVMLGILDQKGYQISTDIKKADIIIINTCGFIKEARKESETAINKALKAKEGSKRRTKVVVAGCYVERSADELKKQFPEVDHWTGVKEFNLIDRILSDASFQRPEKCYLYDHKTPRFLSTPCSWAYLKISEGCSHKCSFCAIPQIKGSYQSRPVFSIKEEARLLADKGVKEINIISQDSTYYGHDLGLKNGLSVLLKELIRIKKLKWIRVLYTYPEEIHDSLLELLNEPKICSYLDCPFQHSNRGLLDQMKRGMDGARALAFLSDVRKKVPDIAFRTTLIVGFPGEKDQQFEELKKFVCEAKFDHLGVFTYSREKNTPCYGLGDPVSSETKKSRQRELMELQSEISLEKNQKYLGQIKEMVVEGRLDQDPSLLMGRTQSQAPEVDGVVFADTQQDRNDYSGQIKKIKVTGCDPYDLYAELIT